MIKNNENFKELVKIRSEQAVCECSNFLTKVFSLNLTLDDYFQYEELAKEYFCAVYNEMVKQDGAGLSLIDYEQVPFLSEKGQSKKSLDTRVNNIMSSAFLNKMPKDMIQRHLFFDASKDKNRENEFLEDYHRLKMIIEGKEKYAENLGKNIQLLSYNVGLIGEIGGYVMDRIYCLHQASLDLNKAIMFAKKYVGVEHLIMTNMDGEGRLSAQFYKETNIPFDARIYNGHVKDDDSPEFETVVVKINL